MTLIVSAVPKESLQDSNLWNQFSRSEKFMWGRRTINSCWRRSEKCLRCPLLKLVIIAAVPKYFEITVRVTKIFVFLLRKVRLLIESISCVKERFSSYV